MRKEKLVRLDDNPGAVINTDNESLKAYKARKKHMKKVDALEQEMTEIKGLLNKILEKLN